MHISNHLDVPSIVQDQSRRFFSPLFIDKAIKLLKLSKVSVSYSKGDLQGFLIVSGIIKDARSHECKITYKKRNENLPEGPLQSQCDCHEWSEKGHCPHSASLFLMFLLNQKQEDLNLQQSHHPPIALGSHLGVTSPEYGKILANPAQLVGAPANATYSSLQYLLHNKKLVHFPIPTAFEGKLIIHINKNEYDNLGSILKSHSPQISFSLKDKEGNVVREINVLESLYIMNWKTGEVFNLPTTLKNFMHKIRFSPIALDVNQIIQKTQEKDVVDSLEVTIEDRPLKEVQTEQPNLKINIFPSPRKNLIQLNLLFTGQQDLKLQLPEILASLSFEGGLLSSFKKKREAYEFISSLLDAFETESSHYKKKLHQSGKKDYWHTLIDQLIEKKVLYKYDTNSKMLVQYDNHLIKEIIKSLYHSFGDSLFRFTEFTDESQELQFHISSSTLFQGLSQFYYDISPYGLQVFYNKNEMTQWRSRVRFERKLSSQNWFNLEMNVSPEELDIIKNVDLETGIAETRQGLVLLQPGQKDLLKFMRRYTQYEGQEIEESDESGIKKFHLPFSRARIFELFELRKLGIEGALTSEEIELCEKLTNFESMPEYTLPTQLENVLRPYQKTGYNWLCFLYENMLGACLADDMGLGKTLQTIAFLQNYYEKIESVLIICPVTLLLNWEKEFEKFSDIPIEIYHGGERKITGKAKIILTSYGVMKKEVDTTFADKNFDVLILDEVQHLKNIRSQGSFAARKIQSNFRICLTGTPVENDLSEFYNIIDLSIPGIWGNIEFVRTSSNKKSRLLARKVARPFILRRTKAQVLPDLPPKIENNIFLNFSELERKKYVEKLATIKSKINNSPSKKRYGEILKGLLELRQSCLWQEHRGRETDLISATLSTKIDFLVETLEQIIEEGHQTIIFSQFTTYLDIIENVIKEKHWKMSRIDGSQSVKKRQQQVDIFQSGGTPIFLISLKAGGVGLNLTAASYVFVMDPWWNPAVEQQAIDRAHRIGQKNTLNVYRPIIKGSVEEKVLDLQKMKKELFYDLLPEDDDKYFTGKLSMEDFEHLLLE